MMSIFSGAFKKARESPIITVYIIYINSLIEKVYMI